VKGVSVENTEGSYAAAVVVVVVRRNDEVKMLSSLGKGRGVSLDMEYRRQWCVLVCVMEMAVEMKNELGRREKKKKITWSPMEQQQRDFVLPHDW
jgi:hypothetical protein